MIQFDYRIIRDEGNETKTYSPTISTELPDLVCIEGPNSSGKSTLLNLIALGLYGQKNRGINESLKRKINDLVGEGHQQLSYYFSITNERNGHSIVASKEDPYLQDMTVHEIIGGVRSILTAESFEKKYNLIYDIPENPIDRFDELTRELGERQRIIGQRLAQLRYFLQITIKDVLSSADPKKLSEFRKESESLGKQLKELEKERSRTEDDLQIFKRYHYTKFFVQYKDAYNRTQKKIDELDAKIKSTEKTGKDNKRETSKFTAEVNSLLRSIKETISELTELFRHMGIKTKDDYIGIWENMDVIAVLNDSDKHHFLFGGIEAFKVKLKELDDSICTDGEVDEARLLEELIATLKHYFGVDVILPGIDKTIPEFIQLLQGRLNQCQRSKEQHDNIYDLMKKLDALENDCGRLLTDYIPSLKIMYTRSKVITGEQFANLEEERNILNSRLSATKKRMEYYRDEMIKSNVKESHVNHVLEEFQSKEEFRMFSSYNEDQLYAKVLDLQKRNDSNKNLLGEIERNKFRKDQEIQRLEEQKPHIYQDYQSELQQLFKIVQVLEQKIGKEFDDNLKLLTGGVLEEKKLTNSQKLYLNAVGSYLGRIVGSIRHIDKDYIVDKIDLISRKIITEKGKTEKGKVIHFTDFGTGQSQSAYLTGILKSGDDRKVIALIDEVAMMDSQSLKPVYEIIRKKYNEGSLLAAIIVQKGERLKVEPIP